MKNVLYGVDDNTGAQIDVTDIAILNTVVAQVSDADGNVYPGDQVTLITDRDFLYVPDLESIPSALGGKERLVLG